VIGVVVAAAGQGRQVPVYDAGWQVLGNRAFQILALFLAFLNVRKILFRLNDKGAMES
jgi:hypothetical protein